MYRSMSGVLLVVTSLCIAACSTMSSKPDSQPAPITEIAMAGASVPPQQHDPSAWPPKQTMPGPGIGALPTGEIGYYMDIQEAKLRQLLGNTGVGVARTGDTITLSMPGRISFASNSARLEGAIEPLLAGISSVLVEFTCLFLLGENGLLPEEPGGRCKQQYDRGNRQKKDNQKFFASLSSHHAIV